MACEFATFCVSAVHECMNGKHTESEAAPTQGKLAACCCEDVLSI